MSEKGLVRELGHIIGFGNMMGLAQECWKELGVPESGVFAIGPCLGFTEPCGCADPRECGICAGTGWVTKGVAHAKKSRAVMLKALQMAYRKHHLNDDSIGWTELSDILNDALCNEMERDKLVEWELSVAV